MSADFNEFFFFPCLPMKQSMSLVHATMVKGTVFSWQIFGAGLYSPWKALKLFILLWLTSYKTKNKISRILNRNALTKHFWTDKTKV